MMRTETGTTADHEGTKGEPTPRVVDTPHGPVEYAEYGQGPAVIVLHGSMGGYDQGLLLARMIGDEGYRYIGVSRPGYLGTPIESGKTPEQQADLCADLLDGLDIDSALVMAVSGGGPCGLYFALRHRDKCRGLVLVSTCGEKIDNPIPFCFALMSLLVRVPWLASSREKKSAANMEQAASSSIPNPDLRARSLQDPDAGPLFKALMASSLARMAQRMPGAMNDFAVYRKTDYPLKEIDVPVLIVHGTADKVMPFDRHAKTLEARIPGAELYAIEGGEHVAIFTHRGIVKARVCEFLRENGRVS